MNLVEKYVDVVNETQGFKYKREVVDYINACLDTQYPYTALNNWASDYNPRPVPRAVVSLMRQTVLPHILEAVDGTLSRSKTQKYVDIINSETAMREQVVNTIIEEAGVDISQKQRKAIARCLETPHVRD